MSVSKRVMLPLPISHRRIFALLSLFNLNPYVVFTILAFWLPLKRGAVPNEARYSHEQRERKNVELKIKTMKYEVAETKQKTVYTRILTITINHLFFKPSINFGLGIVA